jgi:ABC-2 type transport system ATP-binding protein
MADRIGVINKGELILVEDKTTLMKQLGKKQLTMHLQTSLSILPSALQNSSMELSADGYELIYTFDSQRETSGIASMLKQLSDLGIDIKDIKSSESSLEEIFVSLVHQDK